MVEQVAGRYTLVREVGRGGMGAVWLARDELLGRDVALKRLSSAVHGDPVARVEREARVSAMLNHPNIVAIFDLAHDGDESWLVMEYVESLTLSATVRENGPFSPDATAHLMLQAATALAAAHRAGIVHRDVKPGNMLVTPEGLLKLSDFGIARSGADPSLTATGLVTGSPGYLAPEVAAGGTATPASDVWSLGASIFHLVTGKPPYDTSENLMGALYRLVNEEPPRTDHAGWLQPLLRATMERAPERRWSAEQVQAFLARAESSPPNPQLLRAELPLLAAPAAPTNPPSDATQVFAPTRTSSGHRRAWVAAAVLAIAALSLGGWLLGRGGPGDQDPNGSASQSTSTSPTPSAEPTPVAADMEAFARGYLNDAVSDPETGFAQLTPEYQQQSGDIEGYRSWWDTVRAADIQSIDADVEAMTVSYRVRYTMRKGRDRSEDVVLVLTFHDGQYLIAGTR